MSESEQYRTQIERILKEMLERPFEHSLATPGLCPNVEIFPRQLEVRQLISDKTRPSALLPPRNSYERLVNWRARVGSIPAKEFELNLGLRYEDTSLARFAVTCKIGTFIGKAVTNELWRETIAARNSNPMMEGAAPRSLEEPNPYAGTNAYYAIARINPTKEGYENLLRGQQQLQAIANIMTGGSRAFVKPEVVEGINGQRGR